MIMSINLSSIPEDGPYEIDDETESFILDSIQKFDKDLICFLSSLRWFDQDERFRNLMIEIIQASQQMKPGDMKFHIFSVLSNSLYDFDDELINEIIEVIQTSGTLKGGDIKSYICKIMEYSPYESTNEFQNFIIETIQASMRTSSEKKDCKT